MGGKFIPGIYHINYNVMRYMIGSGFSTEIYEWVWFSKILNTCMGGGVFSKSQPYVCTQRYRKRPSHGIQNYQMIQPFFPPRSAEKLRQRKRTGYGFAPLGMTRIGEAGGLWKLQSRYFHKVLLYELMMSMYYEYYIKLYVTYIYLLKYMYHNWNTLKIYSSQV